MSSRRCEFFFFQAEDGIRDLTVTGVQTCALPISTTEAENYAETYLPRIHFNWSELRGVRFRQYHFIDAPRPELYDLTADPHELKRSEERRVGKECRSRWSPYH